MDQDIDPLTQDMNIINTQIGIMEDGVDKDTLQKTYDSFVARKKTFDDNTQAEGDTLDQLTIDVKLVADPYRESGTGGRRRKYSRRGRRSAKKRGTQRKQKRRQRRGSRRAY